MEWNSNETLRTCLIVNDKKDKNQSRLIIKRKSFNIMKNKTKVGGIQIEFVFLKMYGNR